MKLFLSILFVIVLILVIVYFVGPKPIKPKYGTKLPSVPALSALPNYVAKQEAKFKIKPGNEAEIIWADSTKQQLNMQ